MDARAAFKFGFISRCIEAGITDPADMLQHVKQASGAGGAGIGTMLGLDALGESAKALAGAGKDVVETGLNWGMPLALAGPPIAGYIGGNLLGKATQVDDFNADDAKRQEIIDEYHRQADKLRRQSLLQRSGIA